MASGIVAAVIDQLAAELGRSVVINDPTMQMLYASPHYGDEDPVRIRALLHHGADPRARGHVLAQGVSTWSGAGLIPADPEIEMHARVCVPVRFEGTLLALLMVMDADGSLTTGELGRVHEIAVELASVLHDEGRHHGPGGTGTGGRGPDRADEQTVLDLVGADPSTRRGAVAALHACGRGAGFTAVTAVEVAVAGASTTTRPHVEIALRAALSSRPGPERADPTSTMFAVTGESAVLITGCAGPGSVEHHAAEVLDRAQDLAAGHFRCVAGIGTTGDGLGHAVRSLGQARLARRAAALGLRPAVASWTSLGAYGPLLSIPPDHLTEAALPHELQQLRAVDPGGALTGTLRAYLDAAGNGPAAAAHLHVHRTSLYYRLGRIRELTGLDVADGATRAAAHVGFAMADIIDARRRPG